MSNDRSNTPQADEGDIRTIARESIELMAWFVWRVENRTAQSTRTYTRFKNMIERYEEVTGTKVVVPQHLKDVVTG